MRARERWITSRARKTQHTTCAGSEHCKCLAVRFHAVCQFCETLKLTDAEVKLIIKQTITLNCISMQDEALCASSCVSPTTHLP